jgi:Glycosyl transferase family 2
MKLVMTLLVRNEVDVIDAQLAFHLAAGVDFFVVTDHDSQDGTTEVLERYERQGVLHLRRESAGELRQSDWMTGMARMAARDFGADWVINSDADEFWWPSGGDLKQVLERVPSRYGIVRTFVRAFLPRPGDASFAERMTVRFTPPAAINSPFSPFRVNVRLLHRADPGIFIGRGNATIGASSLVPVHAWAPVDVLHFPIRTLAQLERKYTRRYFVGGQRRGEHVRVYEAARAGRAEELYDELSVDEARLQRGVADGSLAVDTRLRDALRGLAADPRAPLSFPPRSSAEQIGYAVEGGVLQGGELVRLQRRVDELAQRIADDERRVSFAKRRAAVRRYRQRVRAR